MPVPVAVGTVRESGVTRIGFLSLSGLKIFKILETAKILEADPYVARLSACLKHFRRIQNLRHRAKYLRQARQPTGDGGAWVAGGQSTSGQAEATARSPHLELRPLPTMSDRPRIALDRRQNCPRKSKENLTAVTT